MKINKKIEEINKAVNLNSQEHLDKKVLDSMTSKNIDVQYEFNSKDNLNVRPHSSFLELMEWSLQNFKSHLKDQNNLTKYVHNRIVIDGLFLQFCKENNVTIECLHKDSIISWNMDTSYEKFFIQGAFLIKTSNVEFLHFASWHKGNQNEDEISFFVIVSDKNYESYLSLRNSFDAWLQARDRSNLYVRVIDGDDIPYTKDNSWDDLFLTDNIKLELKNLVEGFLASKDFYEKNKIPWKRGILLYGTPGCHEKGTPIMMRDGSWKKVEDVKVGDNLMGPDSKPREVLKLARGNEQMYKITPNKGKSFTVNGNHILHLHYSSNQKNLPEDINMSVNDYLSVSKCLKEKLKLVKSPQINFNKDHNLEMDPYILGVWLGDGTSSKPEITSADKEIIDYLVSYASKNNLDVKISKNGNSKAKKISFSAKPGYKNSFTEKLKKLGVWNNKSIPKKYLTASIDARLQLLAGIIDTDGSYNDTAWRASEKYNKKSNKGTFDLIQKDLNLSNQIKDLTLSLGLGFTIKQCTKTIKSINFSGNYYRMSIYGDIFNVPTKLPRKQPPVIKGNKNNRFIGIKQIENVGAGDYYGFTVDKDHLYVMDDFWVTHNCGKTSIIRTIMSQYNFKPVTIVPGANDDAIREAFAYAEEQSPSLLYFEDLDSMLERNDISSFLNLMDGISAKNGLLIIATANEVKKLKANITDRPSRFDRKFEIPLPDQKMAYTYLKKWFGSSITPQKCKELSKIAEQYKFSYAYLKDIYIFCRFDTS
jgi:hypothetical protein